MPVKFRGPKQVGMYELHETLCCLPSVTTTTNNDTGGLTDRLKNQNTKEI